MKVNTLGTEYTIEFREESADPKLKDSDGYFDHSVKLLVVDDMTEHKDDTMGLIDLETYKKKVVRHEIVHAFLHESGLAASSGNVESWEYRKFDRTAPPSWSEIEWNICQSGKRMAEHTVMGLKKVEKMEYFFIFSFF